MMKPAIALVGCGRWGVYILRDLVSLGCEVHVAANSIDSRERAVAGGAASFRERVEDLPAISGAVVAVPTVWHADIIRRLMPRDIPIFVEKPMTPDAEEAKQLAAELSGRLFVMDKWRYHPGIEALRDIAQSDERGRSSDSVLAGSTGEARMPTSTPYGYLRPTTFRSRSKSWGGSPSLARRSPSPAPGA